MGEFVAEDFGPPGGARRAIYEPMTYVPEPCTRGIMSENRQPLERESLGLVFGFIGVVVFGMTLPMTRIAVMEFDPIFIALGRGILASFAAALALRVMAQPVPSIRQFGRLVVVAAGVVVGFPVLATIAMQYVPASHGGVVLAILPIATTVAGFIFAAERPSLGFWLCSLAGTAAVIAFAFWEGQDGGGAHLADLLLAVAVAVAAIGYAVGGVLSRDIGGWQVICWAVILAAPVNLIVMLALGTPINWAASTKAWGAFLYLALFSQLIGFFAWNIGLAIGGVARVSQVQLLQTFVTLLASAWLVGEIVSWREIGFAVLVVLLVAIGLKMPVHKAPPRSR